MSTDVQPQGEKGSFAYFNQVLSYPLHITLLALLLGVAVEILFDGQPLGINFPLWAWLGAGALLLAAYLEGVKPSRTELTLIAPILFLSLMSATRREPLTVFLDVIGVLFFFGLWVRTFRAGRLFDFGWIDLGVGLVWTPVEAVLRPWGTLNAAWHSVVGEGGGRGRGWAIARGLLLAIPVVAVFLALLGAADMIFGDAVQRLLEWLDIERILSWVGDGMVIGLSGRFFLGAMVAALIEPGERKLIGEEKPLLKPFIGLLESGIVLGAVDLLFLIFVLFQVRYLFGGEANITAAGYTYSEYARRGFGELVTVAVLSLGMIMAFGYYGKRETPRERRIFLGLSTALVALLGAILASALMRLLLYESAYGFTRSRTYTHVFIFWMAAGFLAFLFLLYRGQMRRFAPAVMLGVLGFGATLNLMNLDAFIVDRNVERYWDGHGLDVSYLLSLSEDAIPPLVAFAPEAQSQARADLLPGLACELQVLERHAAGLDWPAAHLSLNRALDSLRGLDLLRDYTVEEGESYELSVVAPDGSVTYCRPYSYSYVD